MPNDSSAENPAEEQSIPSRSVSADADAAAGSAPRPAWSWHRFTRNSLLVAAILFLIGLFVVEGVVPHLVPKNFGVVDEGRVYRSGELTTTALKSVVEQRGIKTIIDFGAHDRDPAGEKREQDTADLLGVQRYVLNLEGDATGDPNRYAEALRIMNDPEAQPVLVHCAAGAQRTGCAVALYRSLVDGWDDERALVEAEDYRHDPEDNPKMRAMYRTWKDEIARSIETGEPIETDQPSTPPSTSPTDGGDG